jgi:hypothetical protein
MSVVDWLGYGDDLSLFKRRYVVKRIFSVPMAQGSLARMCRWFCAVLQWAYEQ